MGSQRVRHFSALSAFLYFLFSCLQTYMNPIPTWKRTLIWTCSLFWPLSCFFPSFHSQNDNGTILTALSFSVFLSLLNLCWVFNLFHCSAAFNTGDHPFVCRTNGSWKGSYRKKVKSLSRVRLFATPWTVAYQASLSMGFSRQGCWSGLLFPSAGDLPDPGIEPGFPALQAGALPSEPPGKIQMQDNCYYYYYWNASFHRVTQACFK